MPTENEYKYLLRRDSDSIRPIADIFIKQAGSCVIIEQGCLACGNGLTLRVRHATTGLVDKWLLTMKQDVEGRVVEIEHDISEKDGVDLWSKCDRKLKKVRWKIWYGSDLWEVDRFFDGMRVYCVLAEIELPEGSPPPEILPPFIAENLLYVVPQGDEGFSNKNLWNIPVTDSLYEDYQR